MGNADDRETVGQIAVVELTVQPAMEYHAVHLLAQQRWRRRVVQVDACVKQIEPLGCQDRVHPLHDHGEAHVLTFNAQDILERHIENLMRSPWDLGWTRIL